MGVFVETPSVVVGKAEHLIAEHGAREIAPEPLEWASAVLAEAERCGERVLCVVENGAFDAAGVVYDASEWERALPGEGDDRPRRWLRMPRERVWPLLRVQDREFLAEERDTSART